MADLIHEFITDRARTDPLSPALYCKEQQFNYAQLAESVRSTGTGLLALGLKAGERVAVYLPKQVETVFALFGAAQAGGCFVPVNPILKPRQVAHILPHCQVRTLVTSAARLEGLRDILCDVSVCLVCVLRCHGDEQTEV